MRTLVTAKWSIRADREEQFMSDFQTYERLESAGEDFAYVLVTNEFDAARLRAACERRRQNSPLFTHVVHINPAVTIYHTQSESAIALRQHIEKGRLISFASWISNLEMNSLQKDPLAGGNSAMSDSSNLDEPRSDQLRADALKDSFTLDD